MRRYCRAIINPGGIGRCVTSTLTSIAIAIVTAITITIKITIIITKEGDNNEGWYTSIVERWKVIN